MRTSAAKPRRLSTVVSLFLQLERLAGGTHFPFQGAAGGLWENATAEQPVPRCSRIEAPLKDSNPQPSFFPGFNSGRRGHFPHNNCLCNVLHTGAVCPAFKEEADLLDDKTPFWPVSLKRGPSTHSAGNTSRRVCIRGRVEKGGEGLGSILREDPQRRGQSSGPVRTAESGDLFKGVKDTQR